MQFRLTYNGQLLSSRDTPNGNKARAPHKHMIRRAMHRQLKRLWETHPGLIEVGQRRVSDSQSYLEWAAENWKEAGFRCIPLVTHRDRLFCKLEILMLRYGPIGTALGDIDNRLKTLFDALRKPGSKAEVGAAVPEDGEDPFFVLLEDDRLITNAVVETDTLLEPISDDQNDTRLVLSVTVRPYVGGIWNDVFRD